MELSGDWRGLDLEIGNLESGRFLHLKAEIPKISNWTAACFWSGHDWAGGTSAANRIWRTNGSCREDAAKTDDGRYISKQLMRSGLAAAPNYAEARAAESRSDFIHKLRIVLKELNETKSWLEQIVANGLFSGDKMGALIAENQELCWIIAASIRTARGSKNPV
jgi:four helix bundle protein